MRVRLTPHATWQQQGACSPHPAATAALCSAMAVLITRSMCRCIASRSGACSPSTARPCHRVRPQASTTSAVLQWPSRQRRRPERHERQSAEVTALLGCVCNSTCTTERKPRQHAGAFVTLPAQQIASPIKKRASRSESVNGAATAQSKRTETDEEIHEKPLPSAALPV